MEEQMLFYLSRHGDKDKEGNLLPQAISGLYNQGRVALGLSYQINQAIKSGRNY